jgi:PII-like signaling protein
MLPKGAAKKVTIYINEDTRHHMEPLWSSVFTFLLHKKVAGATVSRPPLGFGPHHVMHTMSIEVAAQDMPVMIEFVDTPERVDELLPTLYEMVVDGMIEVQDTTVIKSVMKGRTPEVKLPRRTVRGSAQLMRIYLGQADRFHDQPLYEAILKRFLMIDIAGATIYRGFLGYGSKGVPHKEGFWQREKDLPVVISVVDTSEKIERAIEAAQDMLQDGLIVISDVESIRIAHALQDGEEPQHAEPQAR